MIKKNRNSRNNKRMINGKKRHGGFLRSAGAVFLAAAMCVLTLAGGAGATVAAAENSAAAAKITLSQVVSGGSATGYYTLTPEESDAPMPEGTADGVYSFSMSGTADSTIEIIGTKPGNWYYTLESVNRASSYTYDVTKYRIGVQWVNRDGTVTFNGITALADGAANDRKAEKIDFNISIPSSPETPEEPVGYGDPGVKKVIQGDTGYPDTTFSFTMTRDDESYPMPEGTESGADTKTLTITNDGAGEFGNITFTATGTYTYAVKEVDENESGFTYDDTVYTVRYEVTEGSGNTLDVERTIYHDSTKLADGDTVTVTNTYTKSAGSGSTTKTSGTTGTGSSAKTSGTTGTGNVKTGDTSQIGLYFGLLAAAAGVMVILIVARRKRDRAE